MTPVDPRLGTEEDYAVLKTLENRIAKNPNDLDALLKKGFLCLDVYEDPNEGLPTLEQALKLDPNNVDTLYWLAKMHYHGTGDTNSVKSIIKKALILDPNRVDCLDLLAEILSHGYGEEGLQESLALSRKAIRLEPSWPASRMRLVSRLIKINWLDEAENLLYEGLEVFKEFKLPENASRMDEYREYMITGRDNYEKIDFYRKLEKIKKLRAEQGE